MNHILIVIYNKNCRDSETICSIMGSKAHEYFKIIVFDNSTIETENREFCEREHITYFGFNENWGLSKAYNYVIEGLPEDSGYLMIFDDDTIVSTSYLLECQQYIEEGDGDIYLPIVKESSTGNILSPLNTSRYKSGFQRLKTIEELDYDRISAINTGMIINLHVFNKIRYNEQLFLDCVDHYFMAQIRNEGFHIRLMKCKLTQHYSRTEQADADAAWNRYMIYKKDYAIYSRDYGSRFYKISLLKYSIESAIRYMDKRFLKI